MPKGLILWCRVQCWWHAPLSEEDTGNNWNDPFPIDKQQLSSFIGMVTYMGNFIPHLSHHTEPLRAMLKQEAVFAWDEMANASFQKIKDLIAKSATKPLRYYDRRKPVTVQADASERTWHLLATGGQANCLCQQEPHRHWDQVRQHRELLAIVFTCQQFNTYVLGRPFTVESDHKPLEMIHQKSLASAPPRLQQMLLQLQWYDVTIKYRPGKEMLLADALSRCPSRASGEIKLDMRVDYIAFSKAWIAKLWGKTPFLAQCTNWLSRGGHTKGGILRGWPGHTGTSDTSSLQMRDCCWWVLELSFHPASMRSIFKGSTKVTSQPPKYNRTPASTYIGQGWMQT